MTGRTELRTGGAKTTGPNTSREDSDWWPTGDIREREMGGLENVNCPSFHVMAIGRPLDTEDAHLVKFLMKAEQMTYDMTLPDKGARWN